MPNNWFAFKQFKVEQGLCGMKVSTDACILGALAYQHINASIHNYLDIGTGTGLLALMVGQHPLTQKVSAIEIDAEAKQQAQQNFDAAPWSAKMDVVSLDINNYKQLQENLFDRIICNPPFFENQLQASGYQKNIAKHEVLLGKDILAQAITHALTEDGLAFILYPASEWQAWEIAASKNGLFNVAKIEIIPKEGKPCNRIVGIFSKQMLQPSTTTSINIRTVSNEYSEAFKSLLSDFYLHF